MIVKTLIISLAGASTLAVGTTPRNIEIAVGPLRAEITAEDGFQTHMAETAEFSISADLPVLGRINIRP